MKTPLITTVALSLFVGCAQQPAGISPVSMGSAFASIPCTKARQLHNTESAKVPSLVAAQKQAVTGDAIGVFLLGVPVSSLSGADLEGEIASTKGKLLALEARLAACGTPVPPLSWS